MIGFLLDGFSDKTWLSVVGLLISLWHDELVETVDESQEENYIQILIIQSDCLQKAFAIEARENPERITKFVNNAFEHLSSIGTELIVSISEVIIFSPSFSFFILSHYFFR